MTEKRGPHLPIGYWVKQADAVLTERIDRAQQANGLTRTDWQVLNLLHELGAATRDEIERPLAPFADPGSVRRVVAGLGARGLVDGDGSSGTPFLLTTAGREQHAAALAVQKEIRERAVQGISEADYLTTVRVLQQIVGNLTTPAGPSASGAGDGEDTR